MPNKIQDKLMPHPELHPKDAQRIKDTLSKMIVEYHALVDDLGKEEREGIHFMFVQVTDMIDACTITEEEEE